MLTKLRRSFRRKKASYCVNCGHVARPCYHQEYENMMFHNGPPLNNQSCNGGTMVANDLKWLDLNRQSEPKVMNADAINVYTLDPASNDVIYSLPQVC